MSLFNRVTPATPASNPMFGGGQQQQQQQHKPPPLFGSTTPAVPPPAGLFGGPAPAASAPSGGGLFGSAPASAAPSGGLFGAPKPATTTAPTGGFGFGAQASATPATTSAGGMFGAKPSTTPAGGGLFGNTPATTSAPANGGFGAALGGTSATSAPAMGGFGAALGGTPATSAPMMGGFGAALGGTPATSAPATGGFGAALGGAPASGGLFGAKPATTGAPTGFGATPATTSAPATGGLFGNAPATTSAPATGGLFGAGAATTTAAKPSFFGAGAAATPSSGPGLFGNPAAQQPGGLFNAPKPATTTATVPAATIDASKLASTTRFEDCHESVRFALEEIENHIQSQTTLSRQLQDTFPIHAENLSTIPTDVAVTSHRITTIKSFLSSDTVSAEKARLNHEADSTAATLSIRTLDLFRLPPAQRSQFIQRTSTYSTPQRENDVTSNKPMIIYFNNMANELENKLGIIKRSVHEVEQSLKSVEMQAAEGAMGAGVSGNDVSVVTGGTQGRQDSRRLNRTLREFYEAMELVGSRIVLARNKVTELKQREGRR